MKITLQRKADLSDTDPLVVQYLELIDNDRQVKRTINVKIGQTLDLPDDLAIEIMQKYRGLFSMGDGSVSSKTQAFAHKGRPQYADKSAAVE